MFVVEVLCQPRKPEPEQYPRKLSSHLLDNADTSMRY
jgi:hypothetical protein